MGKLIYRDGALRSQEPARPAAAAEDRAAPGCPTCGGAKHVPSTRERPTASASSRLNVASSTTMPARARLSGLAPGDCSLGEWEDAFDDLGDGTTPAPAGDPPVGWPSNYLFNAVHMSLIPKGVHQGRLMVFDHHHYHDEHPSNQTRVLRYAIVDPVTRQFWRHIYVLPAGRGDLFCAGHAWTKDGHLFLAGGTGCHGATSPGQTVPQCQGWGGSKLAFVWRPPTVAEGAAHPGQWYRVTDMPKARWYPFVLAMDTRPGPLKTDPMMVAGGTHNGIAVNSYHVWDDTGIQPNPGTWEGGNRNPTTFAGPTRTVLGDYPRMHWLSTGDAAMAGFGRVTDRVRHYANPGQWLKKMWQWGMLHGRRYGTSVLCPISPGGTLKKDYVMAIAGKGTDMTGRIRDTVQISLASGNQTSMQWSTVGVVGSLAHKRWLPNSVLLPDTKTFVIGGEKKWKDTGCSEDPALVPELFDPATMGWTSLEEGTIVRMYHSTALLLPSGKVFTAGGDYRHHKASKDCSKKDPWGDWFGPADYQVFVPPYLSCGKEQPVVLNPPAKGSAWSWTRGAKYTVRHVAFTPGSMLSVERVVLMRAGSVTHHSDGNQRCVQLQFTVRKSSPPALDVTVPAANLGILPHGYYMLFLLTSEGTPSEAVWVIIK